MLFDEGNHDPDPYFHEIWPLLFISLEGKKKNKIGRKGGREEEKVSGRKRNWEKKYMNFSL